MVVVLLFIQTDILYLMFVEGDSHIRLFGSVQPSHDNKPNPIINAFFDFVQQLQVIPHEFLVAINIQNNNLIPITTITTSGYLSCPTISKNILV
jgi:hypothetical protein